jgi:Protein of unknown function (DUF4038)/Domain of unknown function (DUF5060)/Putative collagen-binding domain of a collagenase
MAGLRICLCLLLSGAAVLASPAPVTFLQSSKAVDTYDFVEVSATLSQPGAANCFTDATLTGSFGASTDVINVEGFCDAADGSVFRIRFMPSKPGHYSYTVLYRQGQFEKSDSGSFDARNNGRKGPIRIDPANRWHFVWEGTGEHYFFNGTTAYWIMGWKDERVIRYSIERLHRLKVNRMRVDVFGRTNTFYGEPVMNGNSWSVWLDPFAAENPSDFSHPGFDWRRFNVAYWQKYDRMAAFARDRDMILSLVLDMGDNSAHLPKGSEDERRYIRYAAARLAAFSNITWDLGDDLDHFRDDPWTHDTGTFIKQIDPYKRLATSHPIADVHQDRTSDWFDFTSFQEWSRDQHRYMLAQRKKQMDTGRIIPQTNEEYGYEDHYPLWAKPGSESADVLRRTAWDIYMAGGYQTAGETARRGTNIWPDTGGGWMNGRGDDTMTMFLGYGHIVDFFTSFEWWKTEPHDELADGGNYCLAKPGEVYAVYLPNGGKVTVRLEGGDYRAEWFAAQTGERIPIEAPVHLGAWTSPEAPDRNDWALLIRKSGR